MLGKIQTPKSYISSLVIYPAKLPITFILTVKIILIFLYGKNLCDNTMTIQGLV